MQELEELSSNLGVYLSYKSAYADLYLEDGELIISLELPSEDNYNEYIDIIENFFNEAGYDIEEYIIEGDYEGIIKISQ